MYSYSLEAVNDDRVQAYWRQPKWKRRGTDAPPKPWVAELKGLSDRYGYDRKFIDGKKDFSDANKRGSSGVMIYYDLEEDACYEVQRLRPGKRRTKIDRLFIRNGQEITEAEVRRWLLESAISALTCLLRQESESESCSTTSSELPSASAVAKTAPSCSIL